MDFATVEYVKFIRIEKVNIYDWLEMSYLIRHQNENEMYTAKNPVKIGQATTWDWNIEMFDLILLSVLIVRSTCIQSKL